MQTRSVPISELRQSFNTLDQLLTECPVIFATRHKRPVMAVVSAEYLETVLETIDVLADPAAMRELEASIQDIKAGRLHEHEDVAREMGL